MRIVTPVITEGIQPKATKFTTRDMCTILNQIAALIRKQLLHATIFKLDILLQITIYAVVSPFTGIILGPLKIRPSVFI